MYEGMYNLGSEAWVEVSWVKRTGKESAPWGMEWRLESKGEHNAFEEAEVIQSD